MSMPLTWRKSSHSGVNSDCVQLAGLPGGVAVGDSKDPSGPILVLTPAQFRSLIAAARDR